MGSVVSNVNSSMFQLITKLPSKSIFNIKWNSANSDHAQDLSIPLTTIYNIRGDLVEISIIGYKLIIPQEFLKLIGLALPFHKYLNKLTIRKGGLAQGTIYEINKLLPCSNITEVCLDDNYVSQGNYYIMLNELTSLRILSLCRCSINEVVCESIVRRLEPGRPGDKLQSLSLTTNYIGNKGARKFGDLLRRNRNLLHLNLSDNQITYTGAAAILESLKEFRLNEDEILKKKKNKLAYEKKKIRVYEMILRDLATTSRRTTLTTSRTANTSTKKHKQSTKERNDSIFIRSESSAQKVLPSVYELAYTKAGEIVGDFKDVFDDKNTVEKNNKVYCIGNMRLCYLNLAYNDLNDRILKLIREVLEYQDRLTKPSNNIGLIKLNVEGNLFSRNNIDLLFIQVLLMKGLTDRRGRHPSTNSKYRSKRH